MKLYMHSRQTDLQNVPGTVRSLNLIRSIVDFSLEGLFQKLPLYASSI